MSGTKILIVDDEAMMRMVAKRILSEQYEILTASSGKEAIKIYEQEKPALILSDHDLLEFRRKYGVKGEIKKIY